MRPISFNRLSYRNFGCRQRAKPCLRAHGELGLLHKAGKMLRNGGNAELGIAFLKAAHEMNYFDVRSLNELGNCYLTLKEYTLARQCFRQAQRLDPESNSPLNSMGKLLLLERDFGAAKTFFHKALKKDPQDAYALNGRGRINLEQGQYHAARRFFRRSLQSDPNNADTYIYMGRSFQEEGNLGAAEVWYSKAVNVEPDNPRALYSLAVIMEKRGQIEDLIPALEIILEKSFHRLALLSLARHDLIKARAHLERFKAILPKWQRNQLRRLERTVNQIERSRS